MKLNYASVKRRGEWFLTHFSMKQLVSWTKWGKYSKKWQSRLLLQVMNILWQYTTVNSAPMTAQCMTLVVYSTSLASCMKEYFQLWQQHKTQSLCKVSCHWLTNLFHVLSKLLRAKNGQSVSNAVVGDIRRGPLVAATIRFSSDRSSS